MIEDLEKNNSLFSTNAGDPRVVFQYYDTSKSDYDYITILKENIPDPTYLYPYNHDSHTWEAGYEALNGINPALIKGIYEYDVDENTAFKIIAEHAFDSEQSFESEAEYKFSMLKYLNLPYIEIIETQAFCGTDLYVDVCNDPINSQQCKFFGNVCYVGADAFRGCVLKQHFQTYCNELYELTDYALEGVLRGRYTEEPCTIEFPELTKAGHGSLAVGPDGWYAFSKISAPNLTSIYTDTFYPFSYGEDRTVHDLSALDIPNLTEIITGLYGNGNPFEKLASLTELTVQSDILQVVDGILINYAVSDNKALAGYLYQISLISADDIKRTLCNIDTCPNLSAIYLPELEEIPYIYNLESLKLIDFSNRMSEIVPTVAQESDIEHTVNVCVPKNLKDDWPFMGNNMNVCVKWNLIVNDNYNFDVFGYLGYDQMAEILTKLKTNLTSLNFHEYSMLYHSAFTDLTGQLQKITYNDTENIEVYNDDNLFDSYNFNNILTIDISVSQEISTYKSCLFPSNSNNKYVLNITYKNELLEDPNLSDKYGLISIDFPIQNENKQTLYEINSNQVLSVSDSALENCQYLHQAGFPLLRVIGNQAFKDCSSLQCVFADDIQTMNLYMAETIGDEAFYGCSQLEQVNGRFTTYIGNKAFENSGLQIVNFPMTNLSIGFDCNQFHGCTNMITCYMPYVEPFPELTATNIKKFQYYKKDLPATPNFIPVSLKSLHIREYELSNDDDINEIKNLLNGQIYASNELVIVGKKHPGETKINILNGKIRTQYASIPDPIEDQPNYLHLCLDPQAAPYLSSVFLKNAKFATEYRNYVNSTEFQHANEIHKYSPKYSGSIYD